MQPEKNSASICTSSRLALKKGSHGGVLWTFPFFLLIMYQKTATTIEEQIVKLKNRGMTICDEAKAKEILSDIGYYRLGFYWFPFEKGYPNKTRRTHNFIQGARFEDAVALYYFDNELRNILSVYLHRIEVSFRTTIIYIVSNHYKRNPTWFADSRIVDAKFIAELPRFYKDIRKNEAIKRHHQKYRNDIYAPAWKTLEYMTFGAMLYLYQNLKDNEVRREIAEKFQVRNLEAFESQMKTIRVIRNVCAHGHNLYDIHFSQSIKTGGLKGLSNKQRSNISGGIIVMEAILKSISANRSCEMITRINRLLSSPHNSCITQILSHIVTYPENLK